MKFKSLLSSFVFLMLATFCFSQSCPTSHTAVETSPGNYEITFDQTPFPGSAQIAFIDTVGAGGFHVPLHYLSPNTYSVTGVTAATNFQDIYFVDQSGDQLLMCNYGQTLPVDLLSYRVDKDDRYGKFANVKWTTANEDGNAGFYIEQNGEVVQFVPSKAAGGSGFGPYHYEVQISLELGPNYFALIQEDLDGRTTRYTDLQVVGGPLPDIASQYFTIDGRSLGANISCNPVKQVYKDLTSKTAQTIPVDSSDLITIETPQNQLKDVNTQIIEAARERDSIFQNIKQAQSQYSAIDAKLHKQGLIHQGIEHFYIATIEVTRTTLEADSLKINSSASGTMQFQIPIPKQFYDLSSDGMILQANTPLTQSLRMQGSLVGWVIRVVRREVVVPKKS